MPVEPRSYRRACAATPRPWGTFGDTDAGTIGWPTFGRTAHGRPSPNEASMASPITKQDGSRTGPSRAGQRRRVRARGPRRTRLAGPVVAGP